jgi:hypothetical protein
MIVLNCKQGSDEWYAARIGIPTASCFSKIVTTKKLQTGGAASITYRNKLLAEWLLGVSLDEVNTDVMERGKNLETDAVKWYEFEMGCDTETVGFVTNDTGTVGCSPDRLVGKDGLAEVKAPLPHTHVGYLLDGVDDAYRCQLQGQLWIAERQWVDFISYHPTLPKVKVRIERDEPFIEALSKGVDEFLDSMEKCKQQLIDLGAMNEAA